MFVVLHKHGIETELVFRDTHECQRLFVARVEALCKERLERDGEPFWETKNRAMEDMFQYDEERRRCAMKSSRLRLRIGRNGLGRWGR
jgi:hypothetical protein